MRPPPAASPIREELLALGLPLEGHADNLAAALAGGVCLTWDGRIARVADDAAARAGRARPRGTAEHERESRAALPATVPHADAAFTAGRAALLGAALASGSEELFAAALADRLHEPYRAATRRCSSAPRRRCRRARSARRSPARARR